MTNNVQPDGRDRATTFLRTAAAIVGLEAAAYVVFGAIAIASLADKAAGDSVGVGLFLVAYGLAQLFAAGKLLKRHAGARGPLVFTQLIQVGLAWGLRDSDRQWLGIVMAVAAVVTLACLLSPAVTRALIDEDPV